MALNFDRIIVVCPLNGKGTPLTLCGECKLLYQILTVENHQTVECRPGRKAGLRRLPTEKLDA